MTENNQVKSRERVQKHAEVFTAQREVNAMLDLVKQETERIDSRFLEPACGDGNFLVEILRRKLVVVHKQYRRKPSDYEKNSLLALSSIYGVELLPDNAARCRERLFEIWDEAYTVVCKKSRQAQDCRETARFLLERNILCGNALSMLDDDGKPLVFSQWSMMRSQFNRIDYALDGLLKVIPPIPDQIPEMPKALPAQQQLSLLKQEPLIQQTSLMEQYKSAPDSQTDESSAPNTSTSQPEMSQTDEEGDIIDKYQLTDYWRIAHDQHPIARAGL